MNWWHRQGNEDWDNMNPIRKRYIDEMCRWYWQSDNRCDERFLRAIEEKAGIKEQDVVDWRNLVSHQIVTGRNYTTMDRCLGEFFTQEQEQNAS